MSTIVHQPATASPFDAIRRVDERGEHWLARELQPLMAYTNWRQFEAVVERAMAAAQNTNASAALFEVELKKSSGGRPGNDFRLSRLAAYLIAMNGDPRKPEVASAQTYFAVQTRKSEVAEASSPDGDLDAIDSIVKALRADRQRIAVLEQRQLETAAKLEAIEGQHDWFTALGFARLHGHPTSRPYLAKVGKAASMLLRSDGQEPERRQDATFGTVNTYPSAVLEQAFAEVAA